MSTVTVAAAAKKGSAGASAATPTADNYQGAIALDAATGQVLFEDRADEVGPPASMTKLMTFAVLHDLMQKGTLTLETPVTVAAEDARIGGTQVWLKEKEVFPVEELIYAMMIPSANDAAYALARTAAGSVEAFVELMNAKARELGMTHTTFRTPHGLPPTTRRTADGDQSSPRDFAVLCRHLLLHTDILKYTSVKARKFGEGRRTPDKVIAMTNHNKLLGKVAGVDGLKTGYTKGAAYCLSATAQRNGHRVIVVIMGALGTNGQVDLGHARDLKAIELLERGFRQIPASAPAFAGPAADPAGPTAAAAASSSPSPILPVAAPTEPMIHVNLPSAKQ